MGGGVSLPNVSYCEKENEVHYNPLVIQPGNEIWYTSLDDDKVTNFSSMPFLDVDGNNIQIISNTYENGKGIIKLEKDCYHIGNEAFFNCRALSSIVIPDSVTTIGDSAFSDCTSLTGITIPNKVTSIEGGAFAGWTGATSTDNIVFPNEQLKIKYFESNYAFSGWESLTSVVIPNGVTSIGNEAFLGCLSLTGITIPNFVTTIGERAFMYCSSLTGITIPNSVTSIGECAFFSCTSLTGITIPQSVTTIGEQAFDYWVKATSIDIIKFPNEQLKIKYFESKYAFDYWQSLISVVIPSEVTKIGDFAFRNCLSLTNITISDSVTTIGGNAFLNCNKLSSITILRTTPPTLDISVFGTIPYAVIYVPSESVDTYKTANGWSNYADKIQAIQE